MARPRLMARLANPCGPLLLLALSAARPLCGQEALPNSSRECAICHIRWVDAFARIGPQTGPMQAVLERQAGSGDMCLSCHDGSVADSRFKVWSTRHHTTDSVPSPAVRIPTEKFPLDSEGRMTCATCHTAHAVPDSSDLRTVIFLRQPNIDSSLCLACHPEHAQKSDCQHPLGRGDSPIPQIILDAGGKTSADGHTVFCQTCHEPHGARNAWMLVLPPSKLCIACHTDKAPEGSPPAGAPVHSIGHTYAGFEPPTTLLDERAVFGSNGELSCLSCHRLHDASGARPLLIRNNEDSSLCLECHEKEAAILGSPHDLRLSSPETVNADGEKPSASGPCGACHRIHGWARDVPETGRPHSSGCMECHRPGGPGSRNRPYADAHPVGIPMPQGMSTQLPLDSATGDIGCLTCHDPHAPLSSDIAAESGPPQEIGLHVQPPRSFLRQEGSQLCILCHDKMTDSLRGPHNPAEFEPAVREALSLQRSVGSCRVCHTTHNAPGPHLWARAPVTIESGDPISDLCGACHGSNRVKGLRGTHHPLAAAHSPRVSSDSSSSNASAREVTEAEVGCAACHDSHGGSSLPAQLRRPLDSLCTWCHEDKQGIRNSVHDPGAAEWASKLGFVSRDPCLDCHPIHGPREQSGVWGSIGGQGAAAQPLCEGPCGPCETCHRIGAPGQAVQTPHVGETLAGDPNHLPQNLRVSDDGRILCTTCHDIHQKLQGPQLLRAARRDSGLCFACHMQVDGVLDTPHDLRTSAPNARNVRGEIAAESGPCGSCHLVHGVSGGNGVWANGSTSGGEFGRSLCTCCHRQGGCAATLVPEYVDHPEVALLNRTSPDDREYMPTFDSSGQPSPTGAISCLTCHQPHTSNSTAETGEEPPSRHRMFLRPTTSKRLCIDCHGMEALWRFLYYHKEHRNPSPERNLNPLSFGGTHDKESFRDADKRKPREGTTPVSQSGKEAASQRGPVVRGPVGLALGSQRHLLRSHQTTDSTRHNPKRLSCTSGGLWAPRFIYCRRCVENGQPYSHAGDCGEHFGYSFGNHTSIEPKFHAAVKNRQRNSNAQSIRHITSASAAWAYLGYNDLDPAGQGGGQVTRRTDTCSGFSNGELLTVRTMVLGYLEKSMASKVQLVSSATMSVSFCGDML
ncbi:MAG: hypothetical protein JSU70_22145 [Phycisphaerales bacterium]|nr:MAG: hypothetical protein JSU70_22145 [Phycisphaerales bacterium]